jgi:hypothetical protein
LIRPAAAIAFLAFLHAAPGHAQVMQVQQKPPPPQIIQRASPPCERYGEPVASVPAPPALMRIQMNASSPVTRPRPNVQAFSQLLADYYPPESLRQRQEGTVTACLCILASGEVAWTGLVKSSGWPLLDEATLIGLGNEFAPIRLFEPARDARGRPVDFCDPPYILDVQWNIPERRSLVPDLFDLWLKPFQPPRTGREE